MVISNLDRDGLVAARRRSNRPAHLMIPLHPCRRLSGAVIARGLGPTAEIGARLSYRDQLISPYLGVHYERAFGETSTLRKAEGEDDDAFFVLIGTRILF